MNYKYIIIEKDEGCATIILNRPEKLNSFNLEVLKEQKTALEQLGGETEVRTIILASSGKDYSAGIDITMDFSSTTPEQCLGLEYAITELMWNLEKPVIGAINGRALGYGCVQALACDITIASEGARFGYAEAIIGLPNPPEIMGLIPIGKAKEILLTSRIVDAVEAEKLGLIYKVVPENRLIYEAKSLAKDIMKIAPLAVKYTKKAMYANIKEGLGSIDRSLFRSYLEECTNSDDFKEAIEAFKEKRPPRFKGS